MAALFIFEIIMQEKDKPIRRERVFRDRSQVLDTMTDAELIERYRFPSQVILRLVDAVQEDIEPATLRSHAIPAHIQVTLLGLYTFKRVSEVNIEHIK